MFEPGGYLQQERTRSVGIILVAHHRALKIDPERVLRTFATFLILTLEHKTQNGICHSFCESSATLLPRCTQKTAFGMELYNVEKSTGTAFNDHATGTGRPRCWSSHNIVTAQTRCWSGYNIVTCRTRRWSGQNSVTSRTRFWSGHKVV